MEMVSYTVVLEDSARGNEPLSVGAEDSTFVKIKAVDGPGPFIKIGKDGARHMFLVDTVSDPGSVRTKVIGVGERCPDESWHRFNLRNNRLDLCVSSFEGANDLDPIPVLGTYALQLSSFADKIAEASPNVTLAMYARIALNDIASCPATQFTKFVRPGEEPIIDENDADVALIAGVAAGAFVVIGAAIFIKKKLLPTKSGVGSEVSGAKSSVVTTSVPANVQVDG